MYIKGLPSRVMFLKHSGGACGGICSKSFLGHADMVWLQCCMLLLTRWKSFSWRSVTI